MYCVYGKHGKYGMLHLSRLYCLHARMVIINIVTSSNYPTCVARRKKLETASDLSYNRKWIIERKPPIPHSCHPCHCLVLSGIIRQQQKNNKAVSEALTARERKTSKKSTRKLQAYPPLAKVTKFLSAKRGLSFLESIDQPDGWCARASHTNPLYDVSRLFICLLIEPLLNLHSWTPSIPSRMIQDGLYVDCIDSFAPCQDDWSSTHESHHSRHTASAQSVARKADAGKPRARNCRLHTYVLYIVHPEFPSLSDRHPTSTFPLKGMSAYINHCNLSDFARLPDQSSNEPASSLHSTIFSTFSSPHKFWTCEEDNDVICAIEMVFWAHRLHREIIIRWCIMQGFEPSETPKGSVLRFANDWFPRSHSHMALWSSNRVARLVGHYVVYLGSFATVCTFKYSDAFGSRIAPASRLMTRHNSTFRSNLYRMRVSLGKWELRFNQSFLTVVPSSLQRPV